MEKIKIYLLDTRKLTYSELLSYTNLSEEDIASLDKIKVLEVKKERLVSLYFKRKYIGEFSLNEYGKPVSNSKYFNISHSKGVVVIAISDKHDVGIDIEGIQKKDEDLIKYISSEEECAYIRNEIQFGEVWTSKESLVKCFGTGIKNNIKAIPAFPLNGKKQYNDEYFFSKIIRFNNFIISLTVKDEKEFNYELMIEKIHPDRDI